MVMMDRGFEPTVDQRNHMLKAIEAAIRATLPESVRCSYVISVEMLHTFGGHVTKHVVSQRLTECVCPGEE